MSLPSSRRKILTDLILLVLEKSVDGYANFEDFIYNPLLERPIKKPLLAQALKRLREKGFIEFRSDKELVLQLTDSGRDRALWTKMRSGDEKWDGRWRIVVWDIPEKRRQARDLLRFKLKQLGFKQWQQSIWATKINCTKLLRDFIRKIGIEDWVMVIESDNVGR
ncbi:MAG: hypothetical protein NUV73_02785 [Candidatus Daviesbacteria bacterium]|nr:hypothetical protein [Candidatus Daviesbacteria bacterium]